MGIIGSQREMIERQAERIKELESEIAKLKERTERNPRNSSMPPSAEGLSKPPANRAERRAKTRGKQPGDPGRHLAQVADPDEVISHRPERCCRCERSLIDAEVLSRETRQVFEVPRKKAFVTEHQMLSLKCRCGAKTKACAPPEATAPACYGPGIRALAVYLSVYQHVPYERLSEIFSDLLGISISVGTLTEMVLQAGGRLGLFTDVVTDLLKDAPVVHMDETGARVNGSLHWIHVASSSLYTLLARHKKRGKVATDYLGVIKEMKGVAVHDGWRPYRSYNVVHALCNAHHLRELQAVIERFDQSWAAEMKTLLIEAKVACEEQMAKGLDHLSPKKLSQIRHRYDDLIRLGEAENEEMITAGGVTWYGPTSSPLLRRLERYKDETLRFAGDFSVPFTNNQAERDLRMVKIQQKISGTWRSETGADSFCAIRSYISTMKKHHHDVLQGLRELFDGRVWLPGGT